MGTLEQKINYLKQTKQEIANAIRSKGIEVSDTDSFRSYASKIETIEGGDLNNYVTLDGEQVITGQKSFTIIPILESSPSLDNHSANKKYIDDSINNLNMSLEQEIANNKKILSGGLSGQILTKKTNTDYDVEWSESNIGNLSNLNTENKDNLVNAINDCVVNYIDNQAVPTNEYLNGKRVYAKRIIFDGAQGATVTTKPLNIGEYSDIWIDVSNSYLKALTENKASYTIPLILYNSHTNFESVQPYIDRDNLNIISVGGWGDAAWRFIITVKYTK